MDCGWGIIVYSLWFMVWGLWFMVHVLEHHRQLPSGAILLSGRTWALQATRRLQPCLWVRVWGLGFGVWGLGFGVWGLGFGVWIGV